MEPRIQYAQTADGVSIAYWTLGEGKPLLEMWGPTSSFQLVWQIPEMRRSMGQRAEKRMLVAYDPRGIGLSQRDVTDFSLDALVLDLEAVVDRLDVAELGLVGWQFTGQSAISYAVRHPERVSHLILYGAVARASDLVGTPEAQALGGLLVSNWELFTETFVSVGMGWSAGEPARRYAALMRESITQEYLQAYLAAFANVDVTDLLPQVRCPTLVLQNRQQVRGVDVAKRLASRIRDARLVLLGGDSVEPWLGQMDAVQTAIDEFLGEGEEAAAEPPSPGAFRTVLFTDVEGSTALTQRLGDAKARDILREHERIVREALKAHGGSEVKTMGDGFMASFSSATKALECAITMQRAFAEHNEGAEEPLLVRVGLNAGEPIAEEKDLFGTAVNRAARIAALAQGGAILVANVVRELAEGKEFMFGDRGETGLRGFDDPVRLYEVRWREDG